MTQFRILDGCLPYGETKSAGMGYLEAHEDAEQRMKRGEMQLRCPHCQRYFWPSQANEHVTGQD